MKQTPGNKFMPCVNFDLGNMSLSRYHDTILLNSNQIKDDSKALLPDKDSSIFVMVHCDLDLGICHRDMSMTHPWTMDKNYMKYYPDPSWQ